MQVKVFDEKKAKEALKTCPKIVRDYVKLLEKSNKSKQEILNRAISKLRAQSKPI